MLGVQTTRVKNKENPNNQSIRKVPPLNNSEELQLSKQSIPMPDQSENKNIQVKLEEHLKDVIKNINVLDNQLRDS